MRLGQVDNVAQPLNKSENFFIKLDDIRQLLKEKTAVQLTKNSTCSIEIKNTIYKNYEVKRSPWYIGSWHFLLVSHKKNWK